MPLFIYFFYTLFILAYYVPISYVRAILDVMAIKLININPGSV
ncbi:hypothetical protein [Orientia tsutsugamushi]|nr:hypothetical protein [Orientia tsutsugamushi]